MPSQTLTLSQSQRLQMILAPQLRQSLEMLQVPLLELRAMIQEELEQNPTIEETPSTLDPVEIQPLTDEKEEPVKEMDFEKEFEALIQLDAEWRDYFFQDIQNAPYSDNQAEKRQFLLDSLPQKESLQEHLLNQLHLSGLSDADRQIGEMIIGSVDDDGYLTSPIEDLAASTGTDAQHLEDILGVIQEFHPTGVAARDLRECLLIQLDRIDKSESLAAQVVGEHLDALGAKKFAEIAKALDIATEDVQDAAKLISTLNPKPGSSFNAEQPTYVYPEIFVSKVDGKFSVTMNDDHLPHVRISSHYRKLLKEAQTSPEVKTYVQERIRSGAFLIKSIHQRQKTILRIGTEIVNNQEEFLDHGVSHLKPLTMAQIAEVVGVHETTVSRAVSGKYMQTPIGILEMKYFFTPGIRTADGTEVSNKTVKDMINSMVGSEDIDRPLSDQEIMERLRGQGIKIARRTIAKYRLMLRIPPSHMRKKM